MLAEIVHGIAFFFGAAGALLILLPGIRISTRGTAFTGMTGNPTRCPEAR